MSKSKISSKGLEPRKGGSQDSSVNDCEPSRVEQFLHLLPPTDPSLRCEYRRLMSLEIGSLWWVELQITEMWYYCVGRLNLGRECFGCEEPVLTFLQGLVPKGWGLKLKGLLISSGMW